MGYQCPVCADPQADGHHLANHLAFTAMLGDDDHAAWLDERVPGWADSDPADLAEAVTDFAEETEFPQVFEDTTGADGHDHAHGSDHDHAHAHGSGDGPRGSRSGADVSPPGGVADVADALGDADGDVEDVLAEARELTRRRRSDDGADPEHASEPDPEPAEGTTDDEDGSGEE